MNAPGSAHAGAAHEEAAGRVAFLAGACVWAAIVSSVAQAFLAIHSRYLVDADCYMRLVRTSELLASRRLPFIGYPDSNWPVGETSHWGLPTDFLILLGAIPAGLLGYGPSDAIYWSGFWLSPALLLCSLAIGVHALERFAGGRAALLFAIMLPLAFGFGNFHLPARPDHHSVQALLAAAGFVIATRLLGPSSSTARYTGVWLGIICGVQLWVSVEGLVAVAVIAAAVAAAALKPGDARTLFRFSGSFALAAAAAILLERGPAGLALRNDTLSGLHLAMIAAATLVACIAERTHWAQHRVFPVLATGGTALLVGIVLLPRSVPARDSETWRITMDYIARASSDGMPVWAAADPLLTTLAECFGLPLIIAPLGLLLIARDPAFSRHQAWFLIGTTAVFSLLALANARFNLYATPLLVAATAIAVDRGLRRLRFSRLAGVLAVLAAFALPVFGRVIAPQLPGPHASGRPALAPFLDRLRAAWESDPGTNRTVFTHLFLGPEIMYRWRARILGTPDIRNAHAAAETQHLLLELPAHEALDILRLRGWQAILVYTDPQLNEIRGWAAYTGRPAPASHSLHTALTASTSSLPGVRLIGEEAVDSARGVRLRLFRISD